MLYTVTGKLTQKEMRIRLYILLLIAVWLCCPLPSTAQEDYHYTPYSDDNPLIFEDSWSYWPFSFTNEEGDPRGYNIDLVKRMLTKLDIPYVIRLKSFDQVKSDLKEGHADLICAIKGEHNNDAEGIYGNSILTLLGHSIMAPKKTPVSIRSLNDLRDQTVYVHSNGFAHNMMKQYGIDKNAMPYSEMRDVCIAVSARDSGKVLFNTQSLQWLINKYHLTNMRITPVNMPYAEYHFMSNDTILLERLDSLYDTMVASNEIDDLKKKWFRQEYDKPSVLSSMPHLTVFAIVVALLVATLIVYYRLKYMHIRSINEKTNKMFTLYMNSARMILWGYNVAKDRFYIIDASGTVNMEYTQAMFALFYHKDDFAKIQQAIDRIKSGEVASENMQVRYHLPDDRQNELYYNLKICVHKENKGMPEQLLGIQQDMTEKHTRTKQMMDARMKFQAVFNSMIMDITYFDKDGVLADVNDHAMKTFEMPSKEYVISKRVNISDMPDHNAITDDERWVCTIADLAEFKQLKNADGTYRSMKTIYYESISLPIYDLDENIIGQFEVGCEKTHVVEGLRKVREQVAHINSLTSTLNRLIYSVNKVLLSNKTYQAKYDVRQRILTITNTGDNHPIVMTDLECICALCREERGKMMRIFKRIDKGTGKAFNVHVCTLYKNKDGNRIHYNINAIPMHDKNGTLSYYYCLLRDETDKVLADIQLTEETQKAQETEQLQNLFLKNLNYEIRTPLNAIFGFSELFETEHDPADEIIFVEQIRENTDTVLKLVNDILLLSRLEAGIQDQNYEETDIVGIFKAQCQMGWEELLHPNVATVVECPYTLLYGSADVNSFGLVIVNLCMLSAMNTEKGYVKASMDYHHNTLFIKIVDSGHGFDSETKKHLFTATSNEHREHNYKITLKLMICKLLTEKMGGTFEIDSSPGQGTTVWFTIPFQCSNALRNAESGGTPDGGGIPNFSTQVEDHTQTDENSLFSDGNSLLADGSSLFADDNTLTEGGSFLDTIF